MEELDLNSILNRNELSKMLKDALTQFDYNKNDDNANKGIYVYGDTGIGKTKFVTNILKELNYDVIKYDASDNRNSAIIENITQKNMGDTNILSLFTKKKQKIAILMDEIDGMIVGDKGGINTLIKLIRPKKTKKQKLEKKPNNPIICIGKNQGDKKIKELMKVTTNIELNTPTEAQISVIINKVMPTLNPSSHKKIYDLVKGNLRKLTNIYELYKSNADLFREDNIESILSLLKFNSHVDAKKTTTKLLAEKMCFEQHNDVLYDTDRTSIGLLWHENVIDCIDKMDKNVTIPFYIAQLENMCYADYIDRVTFQNQIWQFNEMSSLIKTFYNNKKFHDFFKDKPKTVKIANVRFTKVLTKYSTEYNNLLFIQKMCQKMGIDKKDLFCFFLYLKKTCNDDEIYKMMDDIEVTKLDVNRIYKYLDKYLVVDAPGIKDTNIDVDVLTDDPIDTDVSCEF
jgi:DNA transposition AAA+ family ATPase